MRALGTLPGLIPAGWRPLPVSGGLLVLVVRQVRTGAAVLALGGGVAVDQFDHRHIGSVAVTLWLATTVVGEYQTAAK